MKIKITLTSLMVVLFLACNSEKKTDSTDAVQTETTHKHSNAEEAANVGLALNKGNKWQSDESTWMHAANLNAVVTEFHNKKDTDLESYQVFAADLQEELGGLVKDCKMKGADHDALHLWLEPIMEDVNDLKKAGTAAEAFPIAETLSANVQKFNQYFENAH